MLTVFEVQHELSKYWKKLRMAFPELNRHPEPKVSLVDLGTTGGYAYYKQNKIELNIHLLQTSQKEMLEDTLPHELAHLATKYLFPEAKQAHGPEFREVLGRISHNTNTKHTMNTNDIKGLSQNIKTKTQFVYGCKCPGRKFLLSAIKHHRMQKVFDKVKRGEKLDKDETVTVCKKCDSVLHYLKDVVRSRTKGAE